MGVEPILKSLIKIEDAVIGGVKIGEQFQDVESGLWLADSVTLNGLYVDALGHVYVQDEAGEPSGDPIATIDLPAGP